MQALKCYGKVRNYKIIFLDNFLDMSSRLKTLPAEKIKDDKIKRLTRFYILYSKLLKSKAFGLLLLENVIPKNAGRVNLNPSCGFSKNASSRGRERESENLVFCNF